MAPEVKHWEDKSNYFNFANETVGHYSMKGTLSRGPIIKLGVCLRRAGQCNPSALAVKAISSKIPRRISISHERHEAGVFLLI